MPISQEDREYNEQRVFMKDKHQANRESFWRNDFDHYHQDMFNYPQNFKAYGENYRKYEEVQ